MGPDSALEEAFDDGMDEFDKALLEVGHNAAERIGTETGRTDIANALKQMMDAASTGESKESTLFEKEVGKLLDRYLTNGMTSQEFVATYDQLSAAR